MSKKTTIESFLKYAYPEPNTGCWLWSGRLTKKGYGNTGAIAPSGYNVRMAHRVSYYLHNGEFNYKLCVCHKCDEPSCVNPQHLFLGTILENTKDMVRKGRASKGIQRPTSVLTEKQVIEIRERYKLGGYTHRALSKEYGLTHSNIHSIINRITWRHIT
jgi:hypothetical protein